MSKAMARGELTTPATLGSDQTERKNRGQGQTVAVSGATVQGTAAGEDGFGGHNAVTLSSFLTLSSLLTCGWMVRGAWVDLREEFERIGAEALLLPLSTPSVGTVGVEEQEDKTCLGE